MKIITFLAFSLVLASACTTVDGDGTTPDAGMTDVDADTNGDEVPGPETAAWPCRGGKDSGGDYFECNPSFMDAAATGETRYWVGICASESINGYWSGPKKAAQLHANGWFRLNLQGTASGCELTVSQCSDKLNAHCWMQYGKNTLNEENAGTYRWCDENGCAMRLERNANHTPTPKGN